MGLFEDLTTYFWNWIVYLKATGAISGCWNHGVWDLVFGDDDGTSIQRCFEFVGGSKVTFPLEYVFAGAPEGGV